MNLKEVIAERKNKTVYRDGNNAIKVFSEDYSKADVLNEALNHARVEETQIDIPSLKEVTKVDGKWAIVSEFISGTTLSQLMEQNPQKMDEYLDMFVDLQMKVHAQRVPLLNKLKDKMKRKINESGLDASIRYELHSHLEGMPKHHKVCHGDFNPSNIIISDNNKAYILDWSHATQGNASADVARTYLLFSLSGDNVTADKYLNLWCKKSDTAKQYVQNWLPIVAASQLVKGKREEKEFLLHWVNIAEYV